MDLESALFVSASGLRAQGTRIKVISENLANAESAAETPDTDPYRRRVVSFANSLDRALGAQTVKVNRVNYDYTEFPLKFEPGHPGANADGYVRMPNVNTLIEVMDMREAQRSYEANLQSISLARGMISRTLELLRG